jgi:hypothetical protein
MALSNKAGQATFYLRKTKSSLIEIPNTDRLRQESDSIQVKVETIESLRDQGVLERVDVLKTDAEGHDLRAIAGAGRYLTDEIMAVKAELEIANFGQDNSLGSTHALLEQKGFILFGLQLRNGFVAEVSGVDALWLRSVHSIIQDAASTEERKPRLLRLISLALLLRLPEYAYVCTKEGFAAGMLTQAEAQVLIDVLETSPFLPSLFAMKSKSTWLPHAFCALGTLASGVRWRNKSIPRANTLWRYDVLFVHRGWLGNRLRPRTSQRLARMHAEFLALTKARQHVF